MTSRTRSLLAIQHNISLVLVLCLPVLVVVLGYWVVSAHASSLKTYVLSRDVTVEKAQEKK